MSTGRGTLQPGVLSRAARMRRLRVYPTSRTGRQATQPSFDQWLFGASWTALVGYDITPGQTITTDPFDPPANSRIVVVARAVRSNHTGAWSWSATASSGLGALTLDAQGPDPGSNPFGRRAALLHIDAGATPPTGVTVTIDAWSTTNIGAYSWAVYCLPAGTFDVGSWLAQTPAFTGEVAGTAGVGATATPTLAAAATGRVVAVGFGELGSGTSVWSPLEAGWFPLASSSGLDTLTVELGEATGGDASGATALTYTAADASNIEGVLFEVAPPAGGGTTFPQSVGGALAPAGAATKQARRAIPLGGAGLPPAATLARSTAKPFTGAVTSAGALTTIRAFLRTFTAAITSSATLARSTARPLAGTTTPAGQLARSTTKPLAGLVTSSATLGLVRAILRSFTGSISSAGALTRTTTKPLAGTAASSATVTRSIGKALAAAIASSATLARARVVLLAVAGVITSAGAVTRRPGKVLAGAVTPSATLATARTFARALAGVLTTGGGLTRQTSRQLAGAVTSAGALTRAKVALLAVAGAITSSAAVARRAGKSLAAGVASGGQLTSQARKPLAGAITSAGALSRTRVMILALSGTLAPAGTLARRTTRGLAGAITPDGAVARQTRKALVAVLSWAGATTATTGGPTGLWSWLLSDGATLHPAEALLDGQATTTDVGP